MKNATEVMNISRILEMIASVCECSLFHILDVCVSIGMSIYREKNPKTSLTLFVGIYLYTHSISKVVVVNYV